MTLEMDKILSFFDSSKGRISLPSGEQVTTQQRYLADLQGVFVDELAYQQALAVSNSLMYEVASIEPASGPGDLAYGLARIMPGQVGQEFYLTKGHLHSWREAAEFYLGLAGEGVMLLEHESGDCRVVPLTPNSAIYVPGYTAHRTVNTGSEILSYLGVYPAQAGHDYAAIQQTNFRQVVLAQTHGYQVIQRTDYQRKDEGC